MLNPLHSLAHSTFTTTLWGSLYKLYSWANGGTERLSPSLRTLQTIMGEHQDSHSAQWFQRPDPQLLWNAEFCYDVPSKNQRVFLLNSPCEVFISPSDINNQVLPQETLSPQHMQHFWDCHSRGPNPPSHMTPTLANHSHSQDFESQKGDTRTERATTPWSNWSLIPDNWSWPYWPHILQKIPGFVWVSQSLLNLVCNLTLPERTSI